MSKVVLAHETQAVYFRVQKIILEWGEEKPFKLDRSKSKYYIHILKTAVWNYSTDPSLSPDGASLN